MPDPAPVQTPDQPARVLGPIDATCIVVGAIIGVGIFFNPSKVALLTRSGDLALLAWAIAGGIALCGALTFAALGTRYNRNGAQYDVLRDAYGPLPAFLFVFCNATAIQAGAVAVIAAVCADNLGAAAGRGAPEGWTRLALAGTLILGLVGANILGVRWGSRIQNLTVYLKVLTLLVVTLLAATSAPADHPPAFPDAPATAPAAITAILAALVPCLFAYGGWQQALWISGEVREAERNLPRAIVGGVVLVVAVYLLANWAYLAMLGVRGVAESRALAADTVAVVWPEAGRRLIGAAVAASAFGVLNAQLLSGPRLVYGMARDGRFFAVFGRLSRFGTPAAAIALIGGMALVLLFTAGERVIELLTTGTVFIDGVFFALTGAAVFVLRAKETKRRRDEETKRRPGGGGDVGGQEQTPRDMRVIGFPVVPALFVLGELGVVAGAHLDRTTLIATAIGAAWIVLAAVLYAVLFRKAARSHAGTEAHRHIGT